MTSSAELPSHFYAWHWDALSYFITPSALKRCLLTCDEASREYFNQCKDQVFIRMFQQMHDRFRYMIRNGTSIQKVWEEYLSSEGFIPKCVPQGVLTNDRFGYVNQDTRQWEEWNVVSVQVMRLYWDSMFQGLCGSHIATLQNICSSLLSTLPGSARHCRHCSWRVPEGSMHNEVQCIYCQSYEKHPQLSLELHRGVTYVKYPPKKLTRPVLARCGSPLDHHGSQADYRSQDDYGSVDCAVPKGYITRKFREMSLV